MTREELRAAFPIGCRVKPTAAYYRTFRVRLGANWPRGEVVGYGRKEGTIRVRRDGQRSVGTWSVRFWERTA